MMSAMIESAVPEKLAGATAHKIVPEPRKSQRAASLRVRGLQTPGVVGSQTLRIGLHSKRKRMKTKISETVSVAIVPQISLIHTVECGT